MNTRLWLHFRLTLQGCLLLAIFMVPLLALAQAPAATTTALTVSPSSTASSGSLVTLTASVSHSGSPVTGGLVRFYDGTHVLGETTLVSSSSAGFTPGTATWNTRALAVGSHTLTAMFLGTGTNAASNSSTQSFTVTGPALTVSSLTAFTNADGTYDLNAIVTGAGSSTPTGTIEFDDGTASSSLGTQSLTALTAATPTIQSVLTGVCTTAVATGDLTGNGKDDLIVGTQDCSTQSSGSLEVMLGKGDGTLQAPAAVTLPSNFIPSSIAVADINGDGVPDLVVADGSTTNQRIVTLLGNGDGTFQAPVTISFQNATQLGTEATEVLVADLNHDGIPDILTVFNPPLTDISQYAAGTICFSNGVGDGTFQAPQCPQDPVHIVSQTFQGLTGLATVLTGDFNGDGQTDLAVQEASYGPTGAGEYELVIGLNTGNETFQAYSFVLSAPALTGLPSPFSPVIAVGDVNNNGVDNVVSLSQGSPGGTMLYVTLGASGHDEALPVFLNPFTLADWNHDGNLDIVGFDPNGQFCVYTGNGDGTFATSPVCTTTLQGVNVAAAGDFRGFGASDLAFAVAGSGSATSSGVSLVTSAIQSASASLTNISASSGDTVTASYSGDANFAPGTSNAVTLGSHIPTTLQLNTPPNWYVNYGDPLTMTATLHRMVESSQDAPATGTIQFYDGSTPLGGPVTVAGNSATYTTNDLTLSPGKIHDIHAVYSGDNGYAASTSPVSTLVVANGVTTLTAQYNGSTTITAGVPISVAGTLTTSQNSPAPTGTIELLSSQTSQAANNDPVLASTSVSGNSPVPVSFTVNTSSQPFSPGVLYLFFYYSGDNIWGGQYSDSTPIKLIVQGKSTLTISDNNISTIPSGSPITVSGNLGANSSAGRVTLLDNGVPIATQVVDSRVTPYTFTINTSTAPLNAGTNSLQLTFNGSTFWTPANSSTLSVTVTPVPTLALASNIPASGMVFTGATVQLTANLSDIGNGPAPTGKIQFYDGSNTLGAPVTVTNGQAAFTYAGFTAGDHSITAHYSGDTNYSGVSSSAAAFHVVSSITDTLTLRLSSPGPLASGTSLNAAPQIQSSGVLGAPPLSGTVTLKDAGNIIATQTFSAGKQPQFQLNTVSNPLSAGTHSFSAAYSGDTSYSASTSTAVSLQITGNTPGFALTSSASGYSNVIQGSQVTFTATASPVQGLATPAGTVQFYVDGTVAGSPVTLQNGAASYSTATLSPGQHTISAAYSGDPVYVATTTDGVIAVVTQGSDTVQLAQPSSTTVAAEQPLTLKGTLNITSLGSAPTGTVSLLDNGKPIASAPLSGTPPFALSFQVNTAGQPLASGTHSFTLQYAGSAVWMPATSTAQSITVQDFTVQAASTSLSVSAGGTATTQINVKDDNGLNSTTTFSCSGLPANATCGFNPAQVTGNGSTTLTITTTPSSQTAQLHWLTGGGASLALLLFVFPRRRRKLHRLLSLCLLLTVAGLASCGGNHMGSSTGGGGTSGTPPGTYTVTVTAATAGSPAITHTTEVTLTVQ